jgi:hypothetical protein
VCLGVRRVERWFQSPKLELLGAAETPRGIHEARIVTLRVAEGDTTIVFRAKWRPYVNAGFGDVPRRELVAYAVQGLFLAPEQYVVPPTAPYCLDLPLFRQKVDPEARATFADSNCVLGFFQYWLEPAKTLDEATRVGWLDAADGPLDRARFERDARYRETVAHLNLLTYLIDHDDSHRGQFVVTRNANLLRVYSVDHSLSFDAGANATLSPSEDWSELQVPALPNAPLERLASLGHEDFQRLRVIGQLQRVGSRLVPAPHLRSGQREARSVAWEGDWLNIGMTQAELDQIARRIADLQQRVREHRVRVFETLARAQNAAPVAQDVTPPTPAFAAYRSGVALGTWDALLIDRSNREPGVDNHGYEETRTR